jgi:hypothetical protein
VNTIIFPNLTSARSSYKMLQALDADVEIIGPIQMGLNKPIHFTDFGSSVRDVVNITAVAVIDAYVDAELSVFDISKDLSLKVEPTIMNNNSSNNPLQSGALGLNCSLNF